MVWLTCALPTEQSSIIIITIGSTRPYLLSFPPESVLLSASCWNPLNMPKFMSKWILQYYNCDLSDEVVILSCNLCHSALPDQHRRLR